MKLNRNLICLGLACFPLLTFAQSTQQIAFNPNQLKIVGAHQGYCIESAASSASNAWRCFADDNLVQDPCFTTAKKSILLCSQAPWNKTVTKFTLTKPLPKKNSDFKPSLPWALVLSDGSQCTLLTGGSFPVNGERANYSCNQKNVYLYGDIKKQSKNWSISMVNMQTQKKQSVTIVKVWD